jgi:hypothetical protein
LAPASIVPFFNRLVAGDGGNITAGESFFSFSASKLQTLDKSNVALASAPRCQRLQNYPCSVVARFS